MSDSSRSNKYQYELLEIPFHMEYFDSFPENAQYINEYMKHYNQYSQMFCNLNDQVADHIINIALNNLTDRQYQICDLLLKGLNQSEIGRKLGVTQKSIQITIFGCYVYKDGKFSHVKGGIINKMKKLILQDRKIKALIRHMHVVDDLFYIRDIIHIVTPSEPKYKVSLNMSYLISTLFTNDDDFKQWLKS